MVQQLKWDGSASVDDAYEVGSNAAVPSTSVVSMCSRGRFQMEFVNKNIGRCMLLI